MRTETHDFELVVCGGGLAGFSAAIAAARLGVKTCLVQDRPVLGGNSSSEIRVTPHGAAAFHAYARETGIVSEVLIEERARNHETIFENGWTNSVWDMTLYDLAQTTPNLTLFLQTSIVSVAVAGQRIDCAPAAEPSFGFLHRPSCARGRTLEAVIGRTSGAETELVLRARMFIDSTGDGLVADLAGCEWRMGSEGREEFGEPHAPAAPSPHTMGNSIHFRARDTGRLAPFAAPEWAARYDDARFFYAQGRKPKDIRGGYWWLEIGVPWDTIHDAEKIRHELTRHTLGVWDWIKNRDPCTRDLARNYALDWLGQVPGKRESRRIVGRHLLTEHDVRNDHAFPDEIAFGGWFIDLHSPGGLLAAQSEPASAEGYSPASAYAQKTYVGPYGIPLRCLIAKDLDNLLVAGRNVSATHVALGTLRVMGTTALLGQAAGTACAHALRHGVPPGTFAPEAVRAIQQQLLRDGCFLPHVRNEDPRDVARAASVSASSQACICGAEPHEPGRHDGLSLWADQAMDTGADELRARRAQWIVVATPRLASLGVWLTNHSATPQSVAARLIPVEHLWDYRASPAAPLAETVLVIPPGGPLWLDWPLDVAVTPGYVRFELAANPHISWHAAPHILPGHVAAFDMGGGRMRRYGPGVTLCFRVAPPQPVFAPENVLSGVTRPHRGTNLWRSDPRAPLPQWLQLDWNVPQRIRQIELTFPGHLVREYHAYGPFYRDPQCPRDYVIEAWRDGVWHSCVAVENNYQRHRRHELPPGVITSRLRITIHATNGDPSAAIYEVRCYS